jgi:hypothetical protein
MNHAHKIHRRRNQQLLQLGLPMSPASGRGGPVRSQTAVARASQIKLTDAVGQGAFNACPKTRQIAKVFVFSKWKAQSKLI